MRDIDGFGGPLGISSNLGEYKGIWRNICDLEQLRGIGQIWGC